ATTPAKPGAPPKRSTPDSTAPPADWEPAAKRRVVGRSAEATPPPPPPTLPSTKPSTPVAVKKVSLTEYSSRRRPGAVAAAEPTAPQLPGTPGDRNGSASTPGVGESSPGSGGGGSDSRAVATRGATTGSSSLDRLASSSSSTSSSSSGSAAAGAPEPNLRWSMLVKIHKHQGDHICNGRKAAELGKDELVLVALHYCASAFCAIFESVGKGKDDLNVAAVTESVLNWTKTHLSNSEHRGFYAFILRVRAIIFYRSGRQRIRSSASRARHARSESDAAAEEARAALLLTAEGAAYFDRCDADWGEADRICDDDGVCRNLKDYFPESLGADGLSFQTGYFDLADVGRRCLNEFARRHRVAFEFQVPQASSSQS
ncbi:hypothetical protein HK405_007398, partial [Cladochytrium tenue]